jgi:hypothetical protein
MAGGICIYNRILALIAPVFKPALHNFRASSGNQTLNFLDFMRFKTAIESR